MIDNQYGLQCCRAKSFLIFMNGANPLTDHYFAPTDYNPWKTAKAKQSFTMLMEKKCKCRISF